MATPVSGEVDDTSILKTGRPACYRYTRDFMTSQPHAAESYREAI
jgi:hypothetical protein